MEGKRVKYSSVTIAQVMIPHDANPAGNVHGGVIMRLIDTAAGVVASRHARSNVVTASACLTFVALDRNGKPRFDILPFPLYARSSDLLSPANTCSV